MNTTWIAVLGALAMLGLVALAVWRFRSTRESSGREDRYSPERLMTPEQAQMLDYLQDTFPGQVVLPNLLLRDLLSVRRAANRKRAEDRLNKQKVDFVVCGDDGKPTFAFDIEQHPLSNARHKAHMVKMKNRILKSAGVRFVFLKNGLHRMPSPADFRKQLNLAELPKPIVKEKEKEDDRDSRLQQLESQLSEFDSINTNTSFRDSEVMGLSGLMDLNQETRRGGFSSAYSNSGFNAPRKSGERSGPSSKSPGESRFDSMDVRGGR